MHGAKRVWTEDEVAKLRQIFVVDYPPPTPLPTPEVLERRIGWPYKSIIYKARKLGIQGRRSTRVIPDKICPVCLSLFRPSDAPQQTCSPSCGQKNNIRKNGHPRGMAGKKHSPETLELLSAGLKERWAKATPGQREAMLVALHNAPARKPSGNVYSRTKSGKRADLDGLFVRSSWEANYARYLNWLVFQRQIAGWRYEPQTFEFPVKRGNRSYTPDFEVTLPNGRIEWHEVKGWMDNNSRIKLERFARHYPQETLVLIDEKAYRSLARDVSMLIEGWE